MHASLLNACLLTNACQMLLQGQNKDAKDSDGRTALLLSSAKGQTEVGGEVGCQTLKVGRAVANH